MSRLNFGEIAQESERREKNGGLFLDSFRLILLLLVIIEIRSNSQTERETTDCSEAKRLGKE